MGEVREGLVSDVPSEWSERWCPPRVAIRTAMPPAAAMAALLSVLHDRFIKVLQAGSRTAALSGCVFMTASMTCWGKGGVVSSI